MILVFGENGQLARSLQLLRPDYHFAGSKFFNLEHTSDISAFLDQRRPKIIINASAYTAVDKAENEEKLAQTINTFAPAAMAQWCAENNAVLFHVSTDYVFDGNQPEAYSESAAPHPINAYGRTKLAGEEAIQKTGCAHFIFRTSWVYGPFGNNFLKTMLRLGQERETLNIVSDQRGAPTYSVEFASHLIKILETLDIKNQKYWGIYNLCGNQDVTWHEFAQNIFSEARALEIPLKVQNVNPISSSQYPTPAKRPLNSRLSLQKIKSLVPLEFASLNTNIQDCLRRIYGH
ncbi:MAG: dTDP-4-dehydrorhamnose reductase [Bdellovibrionales bacterium]|nr:dTDP-4-dehydrorhamnose reductase [Bdellovibrionales bacterium]